MNTITVYLLEGQGAELVQRRVDYKPTYFARNVEPDEYLKACGQGRVAGFFCGVRDELAWVAYVHGFSVNRIQKFDLPSRNPMDLRFQVLAECFPKQPTQGWDADGTPCEEYPKFESRK